ncbi:MAG: eukaryotic-like serine/threonine-protein kinase [Blastocatellia bacterium]|jgi:serine/threonine protein kinase/dipeptidyl aminopeptidase/acylaminoacyl peptidase|nr:eukaryotic-like serine/threonine-protein kinase [Blastocatellia bacterium]
MTPERWLQVKEIFSSAIQYQPVERSAFIARACGGDAVLRKEVESLVAAHEKDGSFIDAPAYQQAAELIVDEKSELKPGQALGSYEIISFISRGGMGEVYLAQDRRLSRKVALKLLPAALTKDDDRLRRFEQEARAASALNHPNIITIYEILKTKSTQAIATEFVEGKTLRQRLAQSALSLGESLNIAIQIADALAAAHKVGIVHRDIKPENIMLRPDGYVKVLDFGLAKLAEHSPSTIAAEAPTRQVRTGSGVVIGTAGYMSPEQARGKDVDARSDVFSLGAVIYEMVAHRKPFEGETPSDILASILKTEPQPLSHFAPEAPAELLRIVNKTLRKDREERYQVVKDLLIDLRSLKQELDFQAQLERSTPSDRTSLAGSNTSLAPAAGPAPQTTEIKNAISSITESLSIEIKRHKTGAVLAFVAVFVIIAAGVFGLTRLLRRTPAHFQSIKISRLTNSGKAIDATISPDGKYIVYSLSDGGKQSIWIRQVSTANDKMIVPPAPIGLFGTTISPDGQNLYYAVKANLDRGTLYRIPILGGTSQKILEGIDGPVSLSPDGKRMVLVRGNFPNQGESSLVIVNSDGTSERTLATKKAPERFSPIFFTGPSWSPDDQLIAATVSNTAGKQFAASSSSQVVSFQVADGKEKVVTAKPFPFSARVQWLPDMSGLLVIGGESIPSAQVWFVSYPGGESREITHDLNAYRSLGVTADGSQLATIQGSGLVNIWVAPEADARRAVQLPTGNVGFFSSFGNGLSWTPDGRIAFITTESGNADVWVMDPDGSNRHQLTANVGQNQTPTVSPDGRYIVFISTRDGLKKIWRMNLDGSNPQPLTPGPADAFPTISADSKWVIYAAQGAAKWTLGKVSIDGGKPIQLSDKAAAMPAVSPDNKFVAYLYPDSEDGFAPANRLGIISIDGGEPSKTFSIQGSGTITTTLHWSTDGNLLLYTINANNVTNIWGQPLDGSAPKQITDFKDSLMLGFAYSHDGKQLACSRGILLRDAVLISEVK